jgi:tetratricopeptide (TPR) repeat protein
MTLCVRTNQNFVQYHQNTQIHSLWMLEKLYMSRSVAIRLLLACSMIAVLFAGCSRDPNVRKQKYFDSGGRYFAEGKYREAAIQYANAVQVDPRFAQAHYQLGETFLKLGDTNRAFQELTRTVELAPDNYRAHVDLANLLLTVRNPDGSQPEESLKQAKTHLDLLRSAQPDSPETHEAWSNYYATQNNLPSALQEMQKAVAADPKRSELYVLLALLQIRSNQPDQGEISLKKAVEVDPKAMNAQMALGGFYQSRNRLPEAEQQFKRVIELNPKDTAPRAALVRLLMAEDRKPDTEAFLQKTKIDLADNSEGYRMLGDFYFATGQMDKAAAEYASLYREHPKDPLVKRNYIQLLILKNRLDEAGRLDDEILKNSPHDVDALIYKGQIQLRRGDNAGAIDTLQNALRKDADNAVAHYQLGVAFDQQHNDARAESEWQDAVRLRPDLTDAQRALASLELRRGETEALLQTAQQIIAAQPNSPDGFLLKGTAEENLKRYPEAQQDLERASQIAPQLPAPYVQLGNIQLVQKHFAEAEKSYRQALEKDPSSVEGLSGVMNIYFAQKQFDQAIAAANAQIAKSPNNSGFYDLLGTALFNGKKDSGGAEAALRKSIDLDKNNLDATEKLGKVEIQRGSADQALALYLQSIKDYPKEIRFYILSGELYEARRDWNHAKTMYQQALALQPEQPLASNNLAYVLLQQGGNVDLALSMAQTARRGMPDSPNAADTLGWAYYQKGIYQSAIEQFRESLRLLEKHSVDDAAVHYHLGLAYEKANQNALARQQLEKALKLSPNNADAKKALSELHG